MSLAAFARDIKLAHTVFALPFALATAWIVARGQAVPWTDWAWILVAMVGARSSAMGFNRIADRRIDALNPRTRDREVASGRLPVGQAWAFTLGSAALLVLAAAMLDTLALALTPGLIAGLWGYSLAKRFTALCHLWLGVALGLAPVAVWVSLTGTFAWMPVLLGLAVALWVGGFDVVYSLQDREFDAAHALRSIPVAVGERGAIWTSRAMHAVSALLLGALPLFTPLAWPYLVGWALIAAVLVWEHSLVAPGRQERLNQAFFAANGYIAVLFLGAVVAGTLA